MVKSEGAEKMSQIPLFKPCGAFFWINPSQRIYKGFTFK
jgi:hypothetical protein